MKSGLKDPSALTNKEKLCLVLASQDKDLNKTAETMHVTTSAVKKYRMMILRKLGCQTMTGALNAAYKNRILFID